MYGLKVFVVLFKLLPCIQALRADPKNCGVCNVNSEISRNFIFASMGVARCFIMLESTKTWRINRYLT